MAWRPPAGWREPEDKQCLDPADISRTCADRKSAPPRRHPGACGLVSAGGRGGIHPLSRCDRWMAVRWSAWRQTPSAGVGRMPEPTCDEDGSGILAGRRMYEQRGSVSHGHARPSDGGQAKAVPEREGHWGVDATTARRHSDLSDRPHRGDLVRAALSGTGQPLPAAVRYEMQHRLGAGFSDVRLHSGPAARASADALDAEAYTSGNHVVLGRGPHQLDAAGRELLRHELVHVVQQRRGPVPGTTTPDGLRLSDPQDSGELAADQDGAGKATIGPPDHGDRGRKGMVAAPAANDRDITVQRRFTSHTADSLETPAQLIKSTFNVDKKDQKLPGDKPLGSVDRAREVEAVVDQTTVPGTLRRPSSKLAVVTSLARTEQMLLQGADIKKFYDAGHLIADQLVGGGANSFEYWNLAPQVSEFNTPAYSRVENGIRDSIARSSDRVGIRVELEYPPDYTVTTADLERRGVIPPGQDPAKSLTVARRIPRLWTLTATSLRPTSDPWSVRLPGDPDVPHLGQPFTMNETEYVAPIPVAGATLDANLRMRHLIARQWVPSTDVRPEDVIGLLSKTFPDLGTPGDIVRRIAPNGVVVVAEAQVQLMKQASGGVSRSLLDVQSQLLEARDPSVLEAVFGIVPGVKQHLDAAEAPTADLVEAAGHLMTAKSWVEDLLEELTEAVERQKRQFPLSLTTSHALQEPIRQSAEAWSFSERQAAPDYVPASRGEEEAIENRTSLGNARDASADPGIHEVTESGGGRGHLKWQSFGFDSPVSYGETLVIRLNDQPVTVVVENSQPLYGTAGIPSGEWLITWKYAGT
ncbi:MAG: DUF4157 domain-containing protein [Saccharothrix sp.]|nr:DUF4157 domain-containing protein [Saccharothrix sp.]